MEIRWLRPGEEAAWIGMDAGPGDAAPGLAGLVASRTGALAEDARCFLVAERAGRLVGKLRGSFFNSTQYSIDAVSVAGAAAFADVGALLLAHVAAALPPEVDLEAAAYLRPDTAPLHALLLANGFVPAVDKVYARRDLSLPLPAYVDPHSYRSLAEVGSAAAVALFQTVNVGSLSAGVERSDPAAEFATLVESAGAAFDSRRWLMAYRDGVPVGLVWPQPYWDEPDEGSLFHIGVVPAGRGRHAGRILHAKGLAMLAAAGVRRYVGSTEGGNGPMRAVFRANGCAETAVRRFYRKAR